MVCNLESSKILIKEMNIILKIHEILTIQTNTKAFKVFRLYTFIKIT
jgi:hypothetical protein